jgi:hypothetical protein
MTASWPIHTEMQKRLNAQETASLASSIYMVCRKRTTSEVGEYPTVRREIEARVREKLAQFWEEGIRGADFFMSAIGPAVEAFGKYARVEKLSGEPVTVAELLEYVRKVVSEFALERTASPNWRSTWRPPTARTRPSGRWSRPSATSCRRGTGSGRCCRASSTAATTTPAAPRSCGCGESERGQGSRSQVARRRSQGAGSRGAEGRGSGGARERRGRERWAGLRFFVF